MLRLVIIIVLSFITLLTAEPLKKSTVSARAAFIYRDILEDSEVLFMFRKGEKVTLLNKKVDSSDVLWHQVKNIEGDSGWIKSENLELKSPEGVLSKKTAAAEKSTTISKRTLKERRMYVKNNSSLNRRFKKFIKEGFVGIGMKPEHVMAALGKPDIKRTVFLLDRGQLPVWIYNPGKPTVILFEDEKVKGWTRE